MTVGYLSDAAVAIGTVGLVVAAAKAVCIWRFFRGTEGPA